MSSRTVEAPSELLKLWEKSPKDYLVFVRNGKPVAYLVSAEKYDEEDIGYMTDPDFWQMIRERRQEDDGIPLEQIIKELDALETAESAAGKRRSREAEEPEMMSHDHYDAEERKND